MVRSRIYNAKKKAIKREIKETRKSIKGLKFYLKNFRKEVERMNPNAHANKSNATVFLIHTENETKKDIAEMKSHLKKLNSEKRRLWFNHYFGFFLSNKKPFVRKKKIKEKASS